MLPSRAGETVKDHLRKGQFKGQLKDKLKDGLAQYIQPNQVSHL